MPAIELFSANICPYAHRVRLALVEKGLDFWHTEVDLENKPEWFMVISPLGEVPVIRHEDRFVAESSVICEYLDEVYPARPLMPRDPGQRAAARFWIAYAGQKLAPALDGCLTASGPEAQQTAAAALRDMLLFIEREGLARCGRGPYWLGSEVSLVDVAYYPFFERLPAIQRLRPVALPIMSIRLRYWLSAMQEREAVKAIANSVDFYATRYEAQLRPRRRASGNVEYLHA